MTEETGTPASLNKMNGVVNVRQEDNPDLYRRLMTKIHQLHWDERSDDLRMGAHYCRFNLSLKENSVVFAPEVPPPASGKLPEDGHLIYEYDDGSLQFIVGRSKADKKPCVDIYYQDIADVAEFFEGEMGFEVRLDTSKVDYLFPSAEAKN